MDEDAIVVFTARSPERVVREGGSQAWVLNPARAKLCKWLVCTQNRHNPDHEFSDATEPHGAAFLVGRISGIVRSEEDGSDGRWLIAISEYARVDRADVWGHWRNPVRYASLAELGIDLKALAFKPTPKDDGPDHPTPHSRPNPFSPGPLTIEEAKRGLAATFGVKPDAVEIVIRG